MDFRNVDVRSIEISPGRGRAMTARIPTGMVQTPPCRCTVTPGPGRFTVRLRLETPLAADFADFLDRVEDRLASDSEDLSLSSTVWNQTVKLTAFDDCLCFDADGTCVPDPVGIDACMCLLDLQGTWVANGRWGVRWKLVQIKRTHPPCMISVATDEVAPKAPAIPMFLDD